MGRHQQDQQRIATQVKKALRQREHRAELQRQAEEEQKKKDALNKALRKPTHLTENLLASLFQGEWAPHPAADALRDIIRNRGPRTIAQFRDFISEIFHQAPKLLEPKLIPALWRIHALVGDWVRTLDTWEPRGHSMEAQYRSLIDHTLVKFPLPSFLYTSFEAGDNETLLFVHLTRGGSVSEAVKSKLLPTTMTKRMCHLFMQAKASTIVEAVRFAQVEAFGGSRRLAQAIAASFLSGFHNGHLDNEDFWLTVIQWFSQQGMLDPTKVGPLLDYIAFRRRENQNYVIKGRSPLAMLEEMKQWHGRLAAERKLNGETFKPSGFRGNQWDLSRVNEGGHVTKLLIWRMGEILSDKALHAEGHALHHCVYSYGYRIKNGQISIWSLSKEDEFGESRAVTVEVNNRTRKLVQARGPYNRLPQMDEQRILNQWATENGLEFRSY